MTSSVDTKCNTGGRDLPRRLERMSDPSAQPRIGTAVRTIATDVDARTGEPRRPGVVWAASGLFLTGLTLVVAGVLWAFWRSVREFPDAAWLTGVAPTEPGSLARVLMVSGLFAVTLLIGAGAIIAAHYGWRGFGWSRWAGVVAAVLSLLALLVNWVAWLGIPLIFAGAALLWTPPARVFSARWHLRRHPTPPVLAEPRDVHYGPLPRYR